MIKKPTQNHTAGGKSRGNKRAEHTERVNGAPVYTAVYKVNHSDELLEFLLRKCNTSRNNVKSLLVRRQVLVNGRVVTQYNYMLAKDDEVKLSKRPVNDGPTATQTTARGKAATQPAFRRSQVKIIYEDDDFIAVDKPAGLLSVESDKDRECAYNYVSDHLQAKDKNARAFVLHRIDKETSGVLVFAKNIKIHSILKLHWNEQVQTREYYAVTDGIFEEKSNTITNYLKENAQYSLLRVKIDTGRKNQIRAHMQWLGHPVVGDDKYGKKTDGTQVKSPMSRLGLHASKLQFIHPITKEMITITSSMPLPFRSLFGE